MFAAVLAERSQHMFLGALLLAMGSGTQNALTTVPQRKMQNYKAKCFGDKNVDLENT